MNLIFIQLETPDLAEKYIWYTYQKTQLNVLVLEAQCLNKHYILIQTLLYTLIVFTKLGPEFLIAFLIPQTACSVMIIY